MVNGRLPADYIVVLPENEKGGEILMAVSRATECKKSGLSTISGYFSNWCVFFSNEHSSGDIFGVGDDSLVLFFTALAAL